MIVGDFINELNSCRKRWEIYDVERRSSVPPDYSKYYMNCNILYTYADEGTEVIVVRSQNDNESDKMIKPVWWYMGGVESGCLDITYSGAVKRRLAELDRMSIFDSNRIHCGDTTLVCRLEYMEGRYCTAYVEGLDGRDFGKYEIVSRMGTHNGTKLHNLLSGVLSETGWLGGICPAVVVIPGNDFWPYSEYIACFRTIEEYRDAYTGMVVRL